jgi:hypothetical protein
LGTVIKVWAAASSLAPTPRYDTVPQPKFMGCQLDAYAAVCSARRPI